MGIHKTRKSGKSKKKATRKSRKTIRRRSRKIKGGESIFTPDNDSLRQAINEYSLNRNNAMTRYGEMRHWNTVNVTNMSRLFSTYIFTGMNDELVEDWDVSNVTDMSYMFANIVSSRFNQQLDKWNVSKVTNMSYMFHTCAVFKSPLNSWNVSNVTNMEKMFYFCAFFNQPLDSWNVSNVTNMSSMFAGCGSFNKPLDNWDVSNVRDMSYMFDYCLSYVVLPTWYQQHQQAQAQQAQQQVQAQQQQRRRIYRQQQRMQQAQQQQAQQQQAQQQQAQQQQPDPNIVKYENVEPEQLEERNIIDITGKTVFDVIMYDEVPIKNYMKENNDAIIFYYINKFYAVKKGDLEKAVIDKSFVKYVCPEAGTMRGIVRTVPYLYGRALGIECGLIKLSQIKQIIQSNDIKFVEIVKTEDEYANSTISLSMLLPDANSVGASHCQEGQDAPIAKLYTFELPT